MTLEETTQLYASVLRQLLPTGGYDTSPNTEALAVDVYAHAKLLAQADLDAKRLLKVLEGFPPDLISEYETEYGLPLKCTVNAGKTLEERIELLKWVRSTRNVLNKAYLEQILAFFGVVLIDIVKFKPMQCTAPCNAPVNTEQLRYKVLLELQYPVNADLNCIIENYLPGYLRSDFENIDWSIVDFSSKYNSVMNAIINTWILANDVDEIVYYCSETPIKLENLPVPKAILTGDLRTYIDTDVEIGKIYYVRIGCVKNSVEKVSNEVVIVSDNLLVFMPLTAGIDDYGSLSLSWAKHGSITHSSDGAYFNDDVASWIKQTTYNFGSTYKFSIEFKRLIGVSSYLPLVYFTENVVPMDLGYSTGTASGESNLVNKVYVDFSYISADATSKNILDGVWYKLTVYREDNNIKVYINDELSLNLNLRVAPNSKSATMLGFAPATTPNKFKGWLKNFKVYDLTP